jgi:hypothetical protein
MLSVQELERIKIRCMPIFFKLFLFVIQYGLPVPVFWPAEKNNNGKVYINSNNWCNTECYLASILVCLIMCITGRKYIWFHLHIKNDTKKAYWKAWNFHDRVSFALQEHVIFLKNPPSHVWLNFILFTFWLL